MNIFTYFINLIKNKSLSSQSVLIMRTPHQECNWAGVPVLPFWTQDPLCSSQLLMDGSQPMTETTACSWERQDASDVDIGHWLTLVTFFPSLHHAGSDLPSLTFTEFSIFFRIWVLLIKPLSYYSWGSQGKNTEVICHSLFQWTTFCQTSPLWPIHLGWPHTAWLSFTELDKLVVRVIRLASLIWLWFQSVLPLMPSLSAYDLT